LRGFFDKYLNQNNNLKINKMKTKILTTARRLFELAILRLKELFYSKGIAKTTPKKTNLLTSLMYQQENDSLFI
jgi:hypothetical protein